MFKCSKNDSRYSLQIVSPKSFLFGCTRSYDKVKMTPISIEQMIKKQHTVNQQRRYNCHTPSHRLLDVFLLEKTTTSGRKLA